MPSKTIEAGRGELHLEQQGGKAFFSTCSCRFPLKLLLPKPALHLQSHLGAAYMLTYGGGLVFGDTVELSARVGENCTMLLLTQGSTKVFKPVTLDADPVASAQRQTLTVYIERAATLLLLPAPVTCFARSSYSQKQCFELEDPTCSLVVLDWLTSGRQARGEHWDFVRYRSEISVDLEGRPLVRETLLLEDDYRDRVEPYSCYATLLLVGPSTTKARDGLVKAFDEIQQPFRRGKVEPDPFLWAYSPLRNEAGVVRLAGLNTEVVRDFLRSSLISLEPLIGLELYRAAWA